jgi:uncharacterized protein (DUF1330 family)
MMAVYVLSEVEILDHELMETYRKRAAASIEKYGGRYLVRGGASELMEGGPSPKALVLVEFPSMTIAKEWYHSPEYAEALKVRERALERRLIFVEGAHLATSTAGFRQQ